MISVKTGTKVILCFSLILYIMLLYRPARQPKSFYVPEDLSRTEKIGIILRFPENTGTSEAFSNFAHYFLPVFQGTIEDGYEYRIYIGVNGNVSCINHLKSSNVQHTIYFSLERTLSYSNGMNLLANYALNDGMDYFVILSYQTILKTTRWTSQIIQALKGHCPSNVGSVISNCCNTNTIHAVHRTHIEYFKYLFPKELNRQSSTNWLQSVYYPTHLSMLPFGYRLNRSSMRPRSEQEEEILKTILKQESTVCAVSYSLYGKKDRYTVGALENANLIKNVYPGWSMWVYHDDSISDSIYNYVCFQENIKCINMNGSVITNKRSWRFLIASEPSVSRFIVRDIDSRLSFREKMAVNEWLHSGRKLHVMRDHPNQNYDINAGMWGGKNDTYPNMISDVIKYVKDELFFTDSVFLNEIVWPEVKHSVWKHDSVTCTKNGGRPYPTTRNAFEHVGSVFIDGIEREGDVNDLKKFSAPTECTIVL